ncbi:MAG: serine/threonine-protein kinase [Planctomycetota bacterium]|nr:serine/threonine-protein kinase [Planctomycetota bacterium]MDP6838127.1 serine/threonine-protein kinase [Planctomycetota bacterium]
MSQENKPEEASTAAEEAFFEFLERVQDGEALRIEDLCAAHPEDEQALLKMHADWSWLSGLVEKERWEREERLLEVGREVGPGEFLERLREHGPSDRRYRVECEINRGGMGRILKIWDEDLGRPLAMKIVDTSAGETGETSASASGFKPRGDSDSASATRPITEVGQRALARFVEEARITGRLQHPAIISAHEVGVDEEGNPYFTMPWVRGRDLREIIRLLHLGEEDWTLPRIIAVLVQVCDAMAFAHSRGVLHRDLKPANIMVGRFGETHVMDWGLARVLGRRDALVQDHLGEEGAAREAGQSAGAGGSEGGPAAADGSQSAADDDQRAAGGGQPAAGDGQPAVGDSQSTAGDSQSAASGERPAAAAGSTELPDRDGSRGSQGTSRDSGLSTRAGAVLGTAGFMSPEQARGELERLGPRSDVYSLGAILYHILAGAPPHVAPGESPTHAELLRRTLAGPPPPPSERAQRGQKAARPGDSGRRLAVPAELEAICAKALARHPLDRYESMGALARDLRAYLEGRVVDAFESGLWAELRKWLARHRAASLAAALVLITGAAWGIERITTQGRHMEEMADKNTQLELSYRETSLANSALGVARDEAQRRAAEARIQSYVGHLSAAEAMLQVHRVSSAAEHLARCPEELRAWEWNYLASRLDESLGVMHKAGAMINAVDWSRNGRWLALCASDGVATVLPADGQGQAINLGEAQGSLRSIAFSPDGMEVATASEDGAARVFNRRTGKVRLVLRGHRAGLWDVSFSHDGALLATCGGDGQVVIWSRQDGSELMRIQGEARRTVWSARFSPTGKSLATAEADGTARIYDLTDGAQQYVLDTELDPELPAGRWPLAWHPAGQLLATGHANGSVSIWRPGRRATATHIAGQGSPIESLAFSPDGRRLATGADDTAIRLWEVLTGRLLGTLDGHHSAPRAVTFSPDGQRLLSGGADHDLRQWLAEAPDEHSRYMGHVSGIRAGRFLPGGRRFVTAAGDRPLCVWEVGRPDPIRVLRRHSEPVHALAVAEHKGIFASGGADNAIVLWDAESYGVVGTLVGHTDAVYSLAFSPDESLLASASRDGTASLWDVASGEQLATLACAGSTCRWVSFAPDGSRLLTSSAEGILEAWDPATGAPLETGLAHERGLLYPTYSPDGKTLATVSPDFTTYLWDWPSGELRVALSGHRGVVFAPVFTPDSKRLLTPSRDRSLRLWDVSTGQQVGTYLGHTGPVWACASASDGSRFLSVGADHQARIWEAADPRRLLRNRRGQRILNKRVADAVENLLHDGFTPEQVVETITARAKLSPAEKHEATILAHQLGEQPPHLNRRARAVAMTPNLDFAAYNLAHDQIQDAVLRDPANEDFKHTLSLVAYRMGQDKRALRLLGRRARVERGTAPCPHPLHALVLALAHARLGNATRAGEELALVAGTPQQSRSPGLELLPLIEEARAALAQLETATAPNPDHSPVPLADENG